MEEDKKEIDTEYTDHPVCPHCGHVRKDSAGELELDEIEGTRDEECEECGKTFIMTWMVSFYFSTSLPKEKEQKPHLCDTCELEFATCPTEGVVFGSDLDPTIKGEEADRVDQCTSYRKKGGE